ncbi:hypothetical protein PUNSTDRAFT_114340 [Punctularia strigosozonata HHB-11173 SS5]|uniref:uncharacterized protein n=1 Tax=Punctularia strigosozonata (strain HHB-11173) TaxID=741275 RepID=UPI0004416BEB|nr:uncharacterized protein PUNSTDRAFT_114340 [Punctularia strigosozonata HHB-11173 SS5]EIN07937.1 hypothetical protein PUNSTDRAFT_114340 [Punctularia strigosozonata HHB-11173 SS5]
MASSWCRYANLKISKNGYPRPATISTEPEAKGFSRTIRWDDPTSDGGVGCSRARDLGSDSGAETSPYTALRPLPSGENEKASKPGPRKAITPRCGGSIRA